MLILILKPEYTNGLFLFATNLAGWCVSCDISRSQWSTSQDGWLTAFDSIFQNFPKDFPEMRLINRQIVRRKYLTVYEIPLKYYFNNGT